jgi:hypothetical protein
VGGKSGRSSSATRPAARGPGFARVLRAQRGAGPRWALFARILAFGLLRRRPGRSTLGGLAPQVGVEPRAGFFELIPRRSLLVFLGAVFFVFAPVSLLLGIRFAEPPPLAAALVPAASCRLRLLPRARTHVARPERLWRDDPRAAHRFRGLRDLASENPRWSHGTFATGSRHTRKPARPVLATSIVSAVAPFQHELQRAAES